VTEATTIYETREAFFAVLIDDAEQVAMEEIPGCSPDQRKRARRFAADTLPNLLTQMDWDTYLAGNAEAQEIAALNALRGVRLGIEESMNRYR